MADESTMRILVFQYTNHRKITETRYVRPLRVWYGPSEYHTSEHWFLRAFDLDRRAERDFLIAGMTDIAEEDP